MFNHFTNSNTLITKYFQNNHVKTPIKLTIHQQIINEGLQLCVVSYGGCSSNTLTNTLEQNNYKYNLENKKGGGGVFILFTIIIIYC